jgi:hypothetical protein
MSRHFKLGLVIIVILVAESSLVFAQSAPPDKDDKSRPLMVFYLAKGAPDTCGLGCNEWIAADGFIDVEATQRLRALLARLRGAKPPIFLNSNGGSQTQAIAIGRLIRERGMTAGVWRTVPEGCATLDEKACRQLMRSGETLTAGLGSGAICMSSCIYALLGGTARQVPPGASLVVHTSRLVQLRPDGSAVTLPLETTARRKQLAVFNDALRTYIQAMGIDGRLFQLILKTPYEQRHWLTRDEIVTFGIDAREWPCSIPERCAAPGAIPPPARPSKSEPAASR